MKKDYKKNALVFKALADETRLNIVDMLSDGELCACKILEHFNITQPTLSYHMKILCESGIVNGKREGAWMRYTLNMEALSEISKVMQSLLSTNVLHHAECCSVNSPEIRI